MVTEIIKQDKVGTDFTCVTWWIKLGITSNALLAAKSQWVKSHSFFPNVNILRNKTSTKKDINPVTKW